MALKQYPDEYSVRITQSQHRHQAKDYWQAPHDGVQHGIDRRQDFDGDHVPRLPCYQLGFLPCQPASTNSQVLLQLEHAPCHIWCRGLLSHCRGTFPTCVRHSPQYGFKKGDAPNLEPERNFAFGLFRPRKVAVHTFLGWSQAGLLRRPLYRNYRKP